MYSLCVFERVPSVHLRRTGEYQLPLFLLSLRRVQNDGVRGGCAVQREAHGEHGLHTSQ